jgi:uncharacterized membrane protein YkvI
MNKKGGFNIVGLLLTFVMLLIYVALLPAITELISDALPHLDSMSQMVIQLFPLVILIMIIVSTIKGQQDTTQFG